VLDIVPILSYNYSIALLVTTAKKTQVITGPAPEKAGTETPAQSVSEMLTLVAGLIRDRY